MNIQRFGGRGASSGARTINGRPIVKSTNGYQFWNIGKNAPEGYIGLIKTGQRGLENTAYLKTEYAKELANLRGDALYSMNNDTVKTIETKIKRSQTALDKVDRERWQFTPEIRKRRFRLENRIKDLKRIKEIKQKLGL